MLSLHKFVAPSRYDELVLPRLTSVNFVVAVKERAIANQEWHLNTLVDDFKSVVIRQASNTDVFLE